MTPGALVLLAVGLLVLVLAWWDMRNTRRQARDFMQRHGLMERDKP